MTSMKLKMLITFLVAQVSAAVVPAVSDLNVSMYVGRWYQYSANKIVMATFERNAVCVTADYALDEDDTYGEIVRIVNSERVKTADGKTSNVTGIAFFANASEPAKLSIKFDPPVPQFIGSYWVISLGPVVNGLYDYAVVSDDKSQTLFVLVRDIARYIDSYASEVDAFLAANGYQGFIYKASVTPQDDCTYPDFPFDIQAKTPVGTSSYCPSSSAAIHAGCDETIAFSNTCDQVRTEILARINGQYDSWYDPHNNGSYTVLSQDSSNELNLKRTTGNKKYSDLINFIFEDDDASCSVSACSESQVTSIIDYGTNHCNIFVLFCGSQDGCAYLETDLKYSESFNKCSDSTSSCLLVTA